MQAESLPGKPADLLSAAAQVAEARGWRVTSKSLRRLEISTSSSLKSFGETIKVIVERDSSGSGSCLVKVSSSARFQALGGGKTQNVNIVMSGMREMAHSASGPVTETSPQPGVKFCAVCGTQMPQGDAFCPGCGQRQDG